MGKIGFGYVGFIFGLNFTNTINESIQKVKKKIEQEHSSKIETSVKNISESYSKIKVVIGENAEVSCSTGFIVDASASASAKTQLAITQNDDFEFDNNLFAQLTDDIENEIKQEQEGGILGQIADANVANTVTTAIQQNENEIKQIINTTMKNSVKQNAESNSELDITILGKLTSDNCNFTADSLSESIASVIGDKINKILSTNTDITELENKIKTTVDQTQKGLDPTVAIVIAIVVGVVGGGGGIGAGVSKNKSLKIIFGFLLLLLGGAMITYSFFIDKSCLNDVDPTNKSECLDEKGKEKDNIKCVCPDVVDGKNVSDTEYKQRGFIYMFCLICGGIFIFGGLILIVLSLISNNSTRGNQSNITEPAYNEPIPRQNTIN
jgi:hypothetical protein